MSYGEAEASLIGTTWQGLAEHTAQGVRMLPGAIRVRSIRQNGAWVNVATQDRLPVAVTRKPRNFDRYVRLVAWRRDTTRQVKLVITRERTTHVFDPDNLQSDPGETTQAASPQVAQQQPEQQQPEQRIQIHDEHERIGAQARVEHPQEQATGVNAGGGHMDRCSHCSELMRFACHFVGGDCIGAVDRYGRHHETWCLYATGNAGENLTDPPVNEHVNVPQFSLSYFRDKVRACIRENRLRRTWSSRHGHQWHALMSAGVPLHKLAHEYFLAWSDDDVRTAKDAGVPFAGQPFEDAEHRTSLDWLKLYATARDKDGHTIPIMLVGPAGCGKSTFASLLAEHLEVPLYVQEHTRDTSPDEIRGMKMPQGPNDPWAYVPSALATAYANGGVHLMDEFDAGDANALCVYHLPLANGYGMFDGQMVTRHTHYHPVAACNTYGSGSRLYMGREEIDEATLSRFVPLSVDYDVAYEDACWS